MELLCLETKKNHSKELINEKRDFKDADIAGRPL